MSVENKLIEYNKNGEKISCVFEFQPTIRTFVVSEYYDCDYDYDDYDDGSAYYEDKCVLEALSYHQFHIDYFIKKNKVSMYSFRFTETEVPYKNSNTVNLIDISENIGNSRVCMGNVNTVFDYNENDPKSSVLLASDKLINHFFNSNYTGTYDGIRRRSIKKGLLNK